MNDIEILINIMLKICMISNALNSGWTVKITNQQIELKKHVSKLTETDLDTQKLITKLCHMN
jgi:hypothetical protein